MAEQAVREQQIYQTRDPLTKAEEQLFEGTLREKKNEEQPVFSETKEEIAGTENCRISEDCCGFEGNRKQIVTKQKCNIRRNQTTAAGII